MKRLFFGVNGALAVTMLTAVVGAQAPAQPSSVPAASQSGQQVKLIGCIQRESDYRQARDKGRGGVAGTGVGVADEFVLTNASAAVQGLSAAGPIDPAYELTGTNESKAKDFVGKRVEITGTLKPAETSATGKPTGGATAGTPPSGVDLASKDLQLREIEVMTVTASTTGTCTP